MIPPRLSMVQEKSDTGASAPDPAARLEALRAVLVHETEVAIELRDELLRQRAAVAGGDTRAVDDSSDATSRLLLALDEAKRRRGDIMAALTGDAAASLDRLEVQLGQPLPASVASARSTLQRAASDVAREAAINRVVLRRAVEAGEAFLQDLFSGGTPPFAVYGAGSPPSPPSVPGRLIDRKA